MKRAKDGKERHPRTNSIEFVVPGTETQEDFIPQTRDIPVQRAPNDTFLDLQEEPDSKIPAIRELPAPKIKLDESGPF